jgi:hypothetical protein
LGYFKFNESSVDRPTFGPVVPMVQVSRCRGSKTLFFSAFSPTVYIISFRTSLSIKGQNKGSALDMGHFFTNLSISRFNLSFFAQSLRIVSCRRLTTLFPFSQIIPFVYPTTPSELPV